MTKEQEEAIERLKRIDIKYFISGMMEQRNYIIYEADKTNNAIETVLSMLEEKDKVMDLMLDNIMTHYQLKTIRKMCCPTCRIAKTCTYSGIHRNCIKQYFGNKAKEE